MNLILASASPRRAEILTLLGIAFTVCPTDCDEDLSEDISPSDAVRSLAERKAMAAATKFESTDTVVLAADTLVACGQKRLGKPKSCEEAVQMLQELSGRVHEVYSGVAIVWQGKMYTTVECTHVRFRRLEDDEIARYVATGEPMDKAGAYGIQGKAGIFVESIEGDYYNVVGLPICALEKMMRQQIGRSLYDTVK